MTRSSTLAGFLWGCAGFSLIITEGATDLATTFTRSAFVLSGIVLLAWRRGIRLRRQDVPLLAAFAAYLMTFLASCLINGYRPADLLRELLLFAGVVTLCALMTNEARTARFIQGVGFSAILLVAWFAAEIDPPLVLTSGHRLETALGSNSAGMIAAIAFAMLYFRALVSHEQKRRLAWLSLAALAAFVVVATKSRTSLVMLTAAFFLLSIYRAKYLVTVVAVALLLVIAIFNTDVLDVLLRIQLPTGYAGGKSIFNLTGRTEIWWDAWLILRDNLFLGVGPERAIADVDGRATSFHNAFVQLLVEVGVIGAAPILVLLIIALKRVLTTRENHLIKTVFLIGMLGALAESRLLNFGNPGSLLFLISFLYLARSAFGTVASNKAHRSVGLGDIQSTIHASK